MGKIAWISGWGIEPQRFKYACQSALPEWEHVVFEPSSEAVERVSESNAEIVGGYSLGSLLLMQSLEQDLFADKRVIVLAPILGFCQETQLGGLTPRSILASLQKRLDKSPEKALQLFYRLAKLELPALGTLPYSLESLKWGLHQLAELTVDHKHLAAVQAVVSSDDPFTDLVCIQSHLKAVHILKCQHDYCALLEASRTYLTQ